MGTRNSWLWKRCIGDVTVVVSAIWIEALGTWGMQCKVNDELVEHHQAEDPEKAARIMLADALGHDPRQLPLAT